MTTEAAVKKVGLPPTQNAFVRRMRRAAKISWAFFVLIYRLVYFVVFIIATLTFDILTLRIFHSIRDYFGGVGKEDLQQAGECGNDEGGIVTGRTSLKPEKPNMPAHPNMTTDIRRNFFVGNVYHKIVHPKK